MSVSSVEFVKQNALSIGNNNNNTRVIVFGNLLLLHVTALPSQLHIPQMSNVLLGVELNVVDTSSPVATFPTFPLLSTLGAVFVDAPMQPINSRQMSEAAS